MMENTRVLLEDAFLRELQEDPTNERGRTILTILYLCVLGLCFVVPLVYYCRLHFFDEQFSRELEFDMEGFSAALEQSVQHRDETRAARRKYIEERRARIKQLMGPVRLVLKPEHFPHEPVNGNFEEFDGPKSWKRSDETATVGSGDDEGDVLSQTTAEENVNSDPDVVAVDLESGDLSARPLETKSEEIDVSDDDSDNPYGDETTRFVELPVPGLQFTNSEKGTACSETRLVPGLCTICLCSYKVGSVVVWSSNAACEHAFHEDCIEKWLMKQREGPLCPCCRRDFIVDPYDLEDLALSPDSIPGRSLEETIEENLPAIARPIEVEHVGDQELASNESFEQFHNSLENIDEDTDRPEPFPTPSITNSRLGSE